MSSNVGIWSPNDLVLPTVDSDLDYKFFLVTEAGSIDGLDIEFNAGDWLVYIKKNGKATWHKTSGGIVNYNEASSSNTLEPGYYSKIRIDNAGNIIDTGYISLEDLPKHTHDISDIQGDIETKIKDTVGQMFVQHNDSSVKFKYDKDTKCVTAEVNYDDATITRNEFGELVAQGGGSGDSTSVSEAYTCGTHTHSASQIEGLEDAIQKVVDANSTIDVHNIPIDDETIKLNSYGQLTAVSSETKVHTHKMDEITDLNPDIANVWASNQILQRDQNYSDGLLNVTNQTIGYAIRVINEYLVDITDRVENVTSKVDTIDIPEPGSLADTDLSYSYIKSLTVIDKDSLNEVIAGSGIKVTSSLFYPANSGKIYVMLDDNKVCELDLANIGKNNLALKLSKTQDSYYGNPLYMGKYNSAQVEYTSTTLDEGYHTLYFVQVANGKTNTSNKIKFQTYKESLPAIENKIVSVPEHNNIVSGIPCYNGNGVVQIEPTIKRAFSNCFIHQPLFTYSINGEEFKPTIRSIDKNNVIHLGIISTTGSKENSSVITIKETAYNVVGNKVESTYTNDAVNWNNTDLEQYRVILNSEFDTEIPSEVGSVSMSSYSSKDSIPNHEMILVDNIGIRPSKDYTEIGGYNYRDFGYDKNGYVWINLKFEAPFMNNLHITCIKDNGVSFKLQQNGTLEGLQLYVALCDNDAPTTWVNGNLPYVGYGSIDSNNFAGLDLFRSTEQDRYITFGQKPNISAGNLFVRIGVMDSISLESVVSSIKESINEWS